MRSRAPNHRLVKTHRTYTVEEIASLFHVHRNTVREWVKRGLPTCDDRRPMLILGPELAAFLQARRLKNRQTCSPGEIYCVRCRAPRAPAGNMAEYQPRTETLGNLIGICPQCECLMHRAVTSEDARRIASHATGFFRLLHEWSDREAYEAGRHSETTRDG